MSDTLLSDASHAIRPEVLQATVAELLGDRVRSLTVDRGELVLVVAAADYLGAMKTLRDAPQTRFEQMIDLCGIDYSAYGDGRWEGLRYAVVVHLLSVSLNHRLAKHLLPTGRDAIEESPAKRGPVRRPGASA